MSAIEIAQGLPELHWPSVIRHYRHSTGLNQGQLADRLAVTQTMVSRWEAGDARPSPRIQELLFDLYWAESATISRDVWEERIAQNPALICVADVTGRFAVASRGLARLFGMEQDELSGRFLRHLFRGEILDLFDTFMRTGFFEGRVASAESAESLEFRHASGEWKQVCLHGLHKPVLMPGPRVLCMMSAAVVSEGVYREVRERLGGQLVVRKAL